MINDNVVDDSNLAQCSLCGFVDDWDEIPKGYCSFTDSYLHQCPECAGVDWFSDYDSAKAIVREQGIKDKAAEANGSGH